MSAMIRVRAIRPKERVRTPLRPKRAQESPPTAVQFAGKHLSVDKDRLEASICRDSFEDFVKRFWDSVVKEPLIWNWHMSVLCADLQEIAERVFRSEPKDADRVYNVPPGSSKSTICSIMFPIWVWTRMPTARTICGSYSADLSLDLGRKSRQVFKSDKFRRLFPELEISDDQDAKGYFANTAGGARLATSTGGTITGFHGHFLIVDDPINPDDAGKISGADLKEANRWVGETLSQRKVDKKIAVTVLIMQRLHQNDPSAVMLERRERGVPIKHFKLPAEITGNGLDQVSPRKLVLKYVDGLLDPRRITREVLMEALVSLGQYGYTGQMLQNPVPLGGGMFKVDRVNLEKSRLHEAHIVRIMRFWDKAGTKDGGAYTVGVLLALDNKGRFWVLDVVRGQWDSAAREKVITDTAKLDGKRVEIGLEQEPGSGGKESAEGTAKRLAGYRVRIDHPKGDKVMRADPFSVQVNLSNVHVVAGPWTRAFLEELQHFPLSKYKDQTDAASAAFALITNRKVRIGGRRKKAS